MRYTIARPDTWKPSKIDENFNNIWMIHYPPSTNHYVKACLLVLPTTNTGKPIALCYLLEWKKPLFYFTDIGESF